MKNRIPSALAAAALILLAGVARAQAPLRIGFVDLDGAKNRSTTIQRALKTVDDAIKPKDEEMQKLVADHRRTREELAAKRSVLSEGEIKKQEARIGQLRDQVETLQTEIERHLRRSSTEVVEPAVDRILETVQRVGKAKGYDLILRSDVVIYGAETHDLTPLVIQELDRPGAPAQGSPALPPPTGPEPKRP